MKKLNFTLATVAMALLLVSCASKKNVVTDPTVSTTQPTTTPEKPTQHAPQAEPYLKKVLNNQVTAQNVVGSMSFNIKSGSKDITVPGSLHMRRNEVIRLQLFIPLIGTEVGRIEFTPDQVLVVDRLHKEYIVATYNQLDFLKDNGLNFYSLQALCWNQVLVPGQKTVQLKDARLFSGDEKSLKLTSGNMTYNWTTSTTGQIVMTNVSYASAKTGASSLLWMYSNFKRLGTKLFPAGQNIQFSTSGSKQLKNVKVNIELDEVKDKSDWDVKTTVSSKYKKVEATDVLGKLMNF